MQLIVKFAGTEIISFFCNNNNKKIVFKLLRENTQYFDENMNNLLLRQISDVYVVLDFRSF